jgi:large subunit ribosomal protein L31
MKKDIHADNYRPVVFQDLSNGETFLTKSTAKTEETIKVDGKEYPLIKVHISSASHPFFTGQEKLLDVEGRVDKFKARAKAAADARAKKTAKANSSKTEKAEKEAPQKIG